MMNNIPNQDLLYHLLRNYYDQETNLQEEKYISSHWKHYSNLFDVKVDDQGDLVSISGQAFGKMKWNGLFDKFLDWATIVSYLLHLPHKKEILRLGAIAVKICNAMNLDPTFDVFRQVCSLELLQRKLPTAMQEKSLCVLMIGDGYGVLSTLFKQVYPGSTIILIDLGKTLLFQAYHCQKAHPQYNHEYVTNVNNLDNVDFLYCPAEKFKLLEGYKFDIAVNITSMQEMDKETVSSYFTFLRKCLQPNNLFYCCNRESKDLIGGEVSNFLNYPWEEGDRFLVDEYCPWHKYFFSGAHSRNGVHVLGIRIPFVNLYDGKHLHRLANLDIN